MNSPLDSPTVSAALQRAGVPATQDVVERLTAAYGQLEGGADAVLEVSQANWANEQQGTDVLVVQSRTGVLLVGKGRRGRFKPPEIFCMRAPFDYYQYIAEDTELDAEPGGMPPHSVVFLPREGHKPFLLSFANRHEQNRMFRCLFEAHAGRFERWGLQLDPENYLVDFDRYYRELCAAGDDWAKNRWDWAKERYGEFDYANALGCALEWRAAELDDRGDSSRLARARFLEQASTGWRTDQFPEFRRLIVRLGEQMYDADLLRPPYDERLGDEDRPLSSADPGPIRLRALMTLAAFARALADPRATEWITAAQASIPALPAGVFNEQIRQLWQPVGTVPGSEPTEPPREIPIWEDVDVREITARGGEESYGIYSLDTLPPSDRTAVVGFLDSVAIVQQRESSDPEPMTSACLRGVAMFESLSPLAAAGWRKLILYTVSELADRLWEKYRVTEAAGRLAQWVVVTIERNGWGPDGRTTPLGQQHSYAMAVAGDTLGVVEQDPATGRFRSPSGEEARDAARRGHF